MKRLLFVIIAAAALYSGYWFVGSSGSKAGFERWFEDRRAAGWLAEYDSIVTRGFPSRFDTTINGLSLADPQAGVAYDAPFLQIFALSYKPEHLIAVWPNEQSLRTPLGSARITSSDMRASLVVEQSTALAVERANFTAADVAATLDETSEWGMESVNIAVSRQDGTKSQYHFGLDLREVTLPRPEGLMLQAGGLLPRKLEQMRGDVSARFDAPWDLAALEGTRPQPTELDVRLIEARWGQLELRFAGKLDIDAEGRADGRITVKAKNWRDIVALARASGVLPDQLEQTVINGLSLLSGLSGNSQTLDLPLDFQRGVMKLGPIPLGPAPIFRLR